MSTRLSAVGRMPNDRYVLSDEERAAIRADILALPPLTDEQLDAVAESSGRHSLFGPGDVDGVA